HAQRAGVAQWESICFASRGRWVELPSPGLEKSRWVALFAPHLGFSGPGGLNPGREGGGGGNLPRIKGGQRARTESLSDTVHFVASDQGGLVPPEARAAREGECERWAGAERP